MIIESEMYLKIEIIVNKDYLINVNENVRIKVFKSKNYSGFYKL